MASATAIPSSVQQIVYVKPGECAVCHRNPLKIYTVHQRLGEEYRPEIHGQITRESHLAGVKVADTAGEVVFRQVCTVRDGHNSKTRVFHADHSCCLSCMSDAVEKAKYVAKERFTIASRPTCPIVGCRETFDPEQMPHHAKPTSAILAKLEEKSGRAEASSSASSCQEERFNASVESNKPAIERLQRMGIDMSVISQERSWVFKQYIDFKPAEQLPHEYSTTQKAAPTSPLGKLYQLQLNMPTTSQILHQAQECR